MCKNITGVMAETVIVNELIACEMRLLRAKSKNNAVITNIDFQSNQQEIDRLETKLETLKRFRAA